MRLFEVRHMRDGNADTEALFPKEQEFGSMAALETDMRNNPGGYKEGVEYTLVPDKPRIKVKREERFQLVFSGKTE